MAKVWEIVYVGPFAEWVLPDDKGRGELWDHDELYQRLTDKRLNYNLGPPAVHRALRYGMGPLPAAAPKVKQRLHCFAPQQSGGNGPNRPLMVCGDAPVIDAIDLTGIDPKAETAWFEQEFADELRLLRDFFGREPVLRWGLLHWLED